MTRISTEQLQKYTVRIDANGELGTGFFVKPKLIMTCFHVIANTYHTSGDIYVWRTEQEQEKKYTATIEKLPADPQTVDLALLRLKEIIDHPCMAIDPRDLTIADRLYTFGYTKIGLTTQKIRGEPVTLEYEGLDTDLLIKLKSGQVIPGLSGSPLLNQDRGTICGVLKSTRDQNYDLGGRAVPAKVILETFPQLRLSQPKHRQISQNPFTPLVGKIKDPNSFFGRENELLWVFDTLNEGSSVAIIGEGGSGKSSILWAIKQQAPKHLQIPRQPIYIDLSQIYNGNDFYSALCSKVKISTVKGYSLTRALENHHHKFLLLLDEVENMTWEGFTNPVRRQLRGLANETNPPLRLVVAASKPLNILFPDSSDMTSPFEGICREKKISLWDEGIIRHFIQKRLAPTPIQFTETEILQLIDQSRYIPRELMRLCHDLYKNKIYP